MHVRPIKRKEKETTGTTERGTQYRLSKNQGTKGIQIEKTTHVKQGKYKGQKKKKRKNKAQPGKYKGQQRKKNKALRKGESKQVTCRGRAKKELKRVDGREKTPIEKSK